MENQTGNRNIHKHTAWHKKRFCFFKAPSINTEKIRGTQCWYRSLRAAASSVARMLQEGWECILWASLEQNRKRAVGSSLFVMFIRKHSGWGDLHFITTWLSPAPTPINGLEFLRFIFLLFIYLLFFVWFFFCGVFFFLNKVSLWSLGRLGLALQIPLPLPPPVLGLQECTTVPGCFAWTWLWITHVSGAHGGQREHWVPWNSRYR